MKNKISSVTADSIAEELGIEIGDRLISINNKEINDIIDYKFLLADDFVEVEVEKCDGEHWILEIEKECGEDLGIEFSDAIMDKAKSCCNNCIFCFVDQLPVGMRDTLYFKDDDSRLSFLQGNFVTLTNMSEEDIDRIIAYRISPINVSVHTTNPELRIKMLNNRFAGNIYDRLKRLAEGGITIHCQIVLCPGFNNGRELLRTVEDLAKLYPAVQNVAAVPVGVTKYRKNLKELMLYSKESAKIEIENIAELQALYKELLGQPFIRLSDEFYVMAEMDVPDTQFYGEFDQLEDGVGMIRYLRDNIEETLPNLNINAKGSYTIVTGASACKEISKVAEKIMEQNPMIKIQVAKIRNDFFGETITVAGLITGKDIINQLDRAQLGNYIILPKNMLRSGEEVFLDDMTISDIENAFHRKVLVCEYSGEDLITLINENFEEVKVLNGL